MDKSVLGIVIVAVGALLLLKAAKLVMKLVLFAVIGAGLYLWLAAR